ncbi:MAG: Ig-like domain-containing protein, partial [Duncaniella sp.]|nr:Ig-like domain-containing protein [Duncaniella sp.]
MRSIGDYAFNDCSGFTGSLTIGNSVVSIGDWAFTRCSGFTGSLTIPNSVTSIESGAFYGCSGLTGSLTIPNSVTSIGESAFCNCSGFTGSLTIGNSVTTIGNWAFQGTKFTAVTSLAEKPAEAKSYTFYGLYDSPLYVPEESINRYKNATEWKKFKYINPISISATSISLNKSELVLYVGEEETLIATLEPESSTAEVIWSVKEEYQNIISVDSKGKVTALAAGEAIVEAKAGTVSATCKVTVNPVPASSVTLNVQDITLLVGATDKLTATVSPENVTDKAIAWSSDNEAIATVDADGNVIAVAVGVANITATCGSVSATCKVTVNPVPASSVTLNVQDITLLVGATDKLTATVSPENVTNPVITWSSDNEAIATVDADGNVTAVAVGVANITATCGDVTATCKVTVNPVPVSSVTLNVQDITLLVGATDKLTATVSPANVTDKVITWTSDNESIATVDADGKVTAVAVGVANITATCGNVSATCKVTVESLAERPEAPTQMLRKGNGTSCTFIAMMALTDTEIEQEGYSFVYGYTDASGNDNVIARTNVRYCHTTPAVYNNSANDFWVFTVMIDDNGEMIGSERRHLDGSVDDDYDLSALLGRSRGIDGSDPDNWITAISRGALITVESADAVVVTVCSLGGQVVMRQETAAGTMVSQEINGDIITPDIYVIRVD